MATIAELLDANLLEIDASEQLAMQQVLADLASTQPTPGAAGRHEAYYRQLVATSTDDWRKIQEVYEPVRHALEFTASEDERILIWCRLLRAYWQDQGLYAEYEFWTQRALAFEARRSDTGTLGSG